MSAFRLWNACTSFVAAALAVVALDLHRRPNDNKSMHMHMPAPALQHVLGKNIAVEKRRRSVWMRAVSGSGEKPRQRSASLNSSEASYGNVAARASSLKLEFSADLRHALATPTGPASPGTPLKRATTPPAPAPALSPTLTSPWSPKPTADSLAALDASLELLADESSILDETLPTLRSPDALPTLANPASAFFSPASPQPAPVGLGISGVPTADGSAFGGLGLVSHLDALSLSPSSPTSSEDDELSRMFVAEAAFTFSSPARRPAATNMKGPPTPAAIYDDVFLVSPPRTRVERTVSGSGKKLKAGRVARVSSRKGRRAVVPHVGEL